MSIVAMNRRQKRYSSCNDVDIAVIDQTIESIKLRRRELKKVLSANFSYNIANFFHDFGEQYLIRRFYLQFCSVIWNKITNILGLWISRNEF